MKATRITGVVALLVGGGLALLERVRSQPKGKIVLTVGAASRRDP